MIGQGIAEKSCIVRREIPVGLQEKVSTGKAVYIPGDIQNELETALTSLTLVGPASISRLGQMAPRGLFQPKSLYDPHRSNQ